MTHLPRAFWVGLSMVAATLVSFALPAISLDGFVADAAVRITDTADWRYLPWLVAVLLAVVATRGRMAGRRLIVETALVLATVLAAGILITAVNEYGVKPLVGSPRPNIVALAESGGLGYLYPDAESFYEVGDKADRAEVLAALLPEVTSPAISGLVRDHWTNETGYSFPSGHSIAAMTLAAAMVGIGYSWLAGWRRLIVVVLVPVWAVLVTFTRVLLEVHRPIDVVAGSIVGLSFGWLVFVVFTGLADRFEPSSPAGSIVE